VAVILVARVVIKVANDKFTVVVDVVIIEHEHLFYHYCMEVR